MVRGLDIHFGWSIHYCNQCEKTTCDATSYALGDATWLLLCDAMSSTNNNNGGSLWTLKLQVFNVSHRGLQYLCFLKSWHQNTIVLHLISTLLACAFSTCWSTFCTLKLSSNQQNNIDIIHLRGQYANCYVTAVMWC